MGRYFSKILQSSPIFYSLGKMVWRGEGVNLNNRNMCCRVYFVVTEFKLFSSFRFISPSEMLEGGGGRFY